MKEKPSTKGVEPEELFSTSTGQKVGEMNLTMLPHMLKYYRKICGEKNTCYYLWINY